MMRAFAIEHRRRISVTEAVKATAVEILSCDDIIPLSDSSHSGGEVVEVAVAATVQLNDASNFPAQATSAGWTCTMCTLFNDCADVSCVVCGSAQLDAPAGAGALSGDNLPVVVERGVASAGSTALWWCPVCTFMSALNHSR